MQLAALVAGGCCKGFGFYNEASLIYTRDGFHMSCNSMPMYSSHHHRHANTGRMQQQSRTMITPPAQPLLSAEAPQASAAGWQYCCLQCNICLPLELKQEPTCRTAAQGRHSWLAPCIRS